MNEHENKQFHGHSGPMDAVAKSGFTGFVTMPWARKPVGKSKGGKSSPKSGRSSKKRS